MTLEVDRLARLAGLLGVQPGPQGSFDWGAVEESLGSRLPADYKLLYGSLPDGWIREFVRIIRPGGAGFPVPGLEDMRVWRKDGQGSFPYPMFPDEGGLLPWGVGPGGEAFCWLTEPGDPGKWPVVAADADGTRWRTFGGGGVAEFLIEVASGRYDASFLGVDLAARGPVFRPIVTQAPRRLGGPRADYYARLRHDREPVNEFAELRADLGPGPAGVRPVDWESVEKKLGCRLPSDYKAFADTYGPGTCCDIHVVVPRPGKAHDMFGLVERVQEQVRAADRRAQATRGFGRREYEPPVYPEPGGMISWGEAADGSVFGWGPSGPDPSKWGVTVTSPGPDGTIGAGAWTYFGGQSFSSLLRKRPLPEQQVMIFFNLGAWAGGLVFTPDQESSP